LADLQSIPEDNREAMRFADTWLAFDRATAEEKRRTTRMTDDEGISSPFREHNFLEASLLATNLAIDLVRLELTERNTPLSLATIKFLEDFIAKSEDFFEEMEDVSFFPYPAKVL